MLDTPSHHLKLKKSKPPMEHFIKIINSTLVGSRIPPTTETTKKKIAPHRSCVHLIKTYFSNNQN